MKNFENFQQLQAIRDNFKQFLTTTGMNEDELSEVDRAKTTELLCDLLNASGLSLPDHGVVQGEFTHDGQLYVECGPKDRWGNAKWEIVVWLDGVVAPTTYDLNLGGLYEGEELKIYDIIENPNILMDALKRMIERYNDDVQELIDEGEYDFNINN